MKDRTFKNKFFGNIALLISSAIALTSCGGSPLKIGSQLQSAADTDFPNPPNVPNSGGSAGSPTSQSSPPPLPPLSLLIEGVGYNDVVVTVPTKTKLKLSFMPGVQTTAIEGTGTYPQYARLGVYLRVGANELPTPMQGNGFISMYPQQKHSPIDFSNSFTKECDPNDTGCIENVTVTIKRPNNDYWCLNYGSNCDWTHVHYSHPWNGTLFVETDFSGPIQ